MRWRKNPDPWAKVAKLLDSETKKLLDESTPAQPTEQRRHRWRRALDE